MPKFPQSPPRASSPSWFAAAILAAPYVLQYHRLLWDASFAVPLGTIALAAFASFLRTGSARTLGVTVAGALLVPTIHPQGLPFTLAVLGWLGWRQRPALRAHWKMLATVLLGLSASHAIWFIEAVYGFLHNLSGSVAHGYPHGADRVICALAPLLGGNLIGSPHILRQIVADTWLERLAALLYVVFPLAWVGIFTALRRARKMESPRDVVGLVAVAGLVLQALLFGLMRIPAEPQYFFGTFALHALLIWLAVDELRVFRTRTVLGGIFGIAAVSLSVGLAIEVRAAGYRPELSWPTLHNQLALAGKLNAFTDTTASTTVPLYQKYPQALRALRLLNPPGPTDKQTASGKLFIAPRGPDRGEVKLDEGAPGDGATSMDITPLPKGWHPDTW